MVNETILKYLKENIDKYDLKELEEKIISSGYTKEELIEALDSLGLVEKKNEKDFTDTKKLIKLKFQKPVKTEVSKDINERIDDNHPKKSDSLLQISFVFGVIFIFIFVILGIYFLFYNDIILAINNSFNSQYIDLSLIILLSLSSIIFFLGFHKIGKVKELKTLKISSLLMLFLIPIFLIGVFYLFYINKLVIFNYLSGEEIGKYFLGEASLNIEFFLSFFIMLVSVVFLSVYFIGLIYSNSKIKLSKTSGILGLIILYFSLILVLLSPFLNSLSILGNTDPLYLFYLAVNIISFLLWIVLMILLEMILYENSK